MLPQARSSGHQDAGNDIGFADIVRDCLFFDSCVDEIEAARQQLPALKSRLVDLYREVQAASYAPNANIVVTSYPYVVGAGGVQQLACR